MARSAAPAGGAGITGGIRGFFRMIWWLCVVSVLAAGATMPFAAHHFGTVTPWGVIANIVAIPLTGMWIMPPGMLVLITQMLAPAFTAVPVAIMQFGTELLSMVAHFMAELPAAGLRVKPPSGFVLIIGLLAVLCITLANGRWHRCCAVGGIVMAATV